VFHRKHDPKTLKVVSTTFTKQDLEYLLKNALPSTEEVPFNTPKKHHQKSKACRIEHVEFEKFQVRLKFPQNIVRLRDGSVLFCDEFESDSSGTNIALIGRLVKSKGCEVFPGSLAVGCTLMKSEDGDSSCCLSGEKTTIPACQVASKCSMFPAISSDFVISEDLLKNPEKVLHPQSFGDWIVVDMLP
jgi:hypothetical protein